MPESLPRHLRFGRYRLDRQAREIHGVDGAVLALTGKAFDTLCCLIDRRDRVVGKDELLAVVWAGRVVEENNLTQAVSALRRALGSDGHYIVTVPGRGYQFVADVDSEEVRGASPAERPARSAKLALIAALAGVLALALGLAWRQGQPSTPTASAPAVTDGERTLAVLPFRSLSPGPRDELLELGLAETLISRISGSTSLRVRSLTTTEQLGAVAGDAIESGRKLGAVYVVEGNTQRRGKRVRVNARLLDVRNGRALWSGTFDESIDRAFTLQDGLASALSSALAFKLSAPPVHGRSPCDGADANAYRAYLAGRYQLDRPSAPRMREALAQFRRALDLDPSCARAYAGMAFAWRALAMTGDQDPRQTFPSAKAAVARALAIDPDSAEAYTAQGFNRFWYDWDWPGAEASLRRAIALNPSLAEARMAYAHLLRNLGRSHEAAYQARQAIALDPLSPLISTLCSAFLAGDGDTAGAKRALDHALALDPDFWTALLVRSGGLIKRREYSIAIADLQRASRGCGDCSQALAVLGQAYAESGDRVRAEQLVRDMEQQRRDGYLPATSVASILAALGQEDRAMDLLERAYQERDVRMTFLLADSRWDPLRALPRFQALAAKIGLPREVASKVAGN